MSAVDLVQSPQRSLLCGEEKMILAALSRWEGIPPGNTIVLQCEGMTWE